MEYVRILKGTTILEERLMHRAPIAGEYIWLENNSNLVKVIEVHWRNDGHASVLVSDNL